MDFPLIVFTILISAVVAELEIQIEGKNGWAARLPTWRVSNRLTSFILGGAYHPLTGYHFFLGFFVILFFHFPFFAGLSWSPGFELRLISLFLFFWMIEDFLWFIFNPNYGFKKFRKGEIPWHQRWVFGVPFSYYKFLSAGLLFYVASYLF